MAETKNPDVITSMAIEKSRQQLTLDFSQAKILAKSGVFPDAKTAEAAMAKILLGRDLGLNATQAMTGIHIVKGKPQVAAVTLASFVRELPTTRYQIVEHTDEACEIHFFDSAQPGPRGKLDGLRHAETCLGWDDEDACSCNPSQQRDDETFLGTSRFTKSDAERAGLLKASSSGEPSNHTRYPRNMNYSRAMSNGVKWHCPEATHGIPVYHEGELDEPIRIDGGAATVEKPPPVALQDAIDAFEQDLQQRFCDAYADAADLRQGQVTPAAVLMSVKDQPREAQLGYLERLEADNARARQDRDVEVVQDAQVTEDPEAVNTVEDASVEESRLIAQTRKAELEQRLGDEDLTELERSEVEAEIDMLDALLDEGSDE